MYWEREYLEFLILNDYKWCVLECFKNDRCNVCKLIVDESIIKFVLFL